MTIVFMNFTGGLVTFYFAFIHQNPPIVYFNAPLPTVKPEYMPGEDVAVHAEFCRYTDNSVLMFVEIRFSESVSLALPPVQRGGFTRGCHTTNFVVAKIPPDFPPGPVSLFVRSEYRVNPIGLRVVEWETQEFQIIESIADTLTARNGDGRPTMRHLLKGFGHYGEDR